MVTKAEKLCKQGIFSFLVVMVLPALVCAQTLSDPETQGQAEPDTETRFDLVQNPKNTQPESPRSGTILLPDSMSQSGQEEKKCMTVCARWGEDCTYINRGTAGTTRNCRRTCQQFTEECF